MSKITPSRSSRFCVEAIGAVAESSPPIASESTSTGSPSAMLNTTFTARSSYDVTVVSTAAL
jgi:hypothetical protein